jgi:hypothetical protein
MLGRYELQYDLKAAISFAITLIQYRFTVQYLVLVKCTDIHLQSAEIKCRSVNLFSLEYLHYVRRYGITSVYSILDFIQKGNNV